MSATLRVGEKKTTAVESRSGVDAALTRVEVHMAAVPSSDPDAINITHMPEEVRFDLVNFFIIIFIEFDGANARSLLRAFSCVRANNTQVLLHIFTFLFVEDLLVVGAVCRSFRAVSKDNGLANNYRYGAPGRFTSSSSSCSGVVGVGVVGAFLIADGGDLHQT
jgi:hypothetical protein